MKKFTLIELLIVVAIIGILATLLFPSLSRAREKARLVVCFSNTAQIARAFNLYASANNGLTPFLSWYNNHSGTQAKSGAGVVNIYGTPSSGRGWNTAVTESQKPLNQYLKKATVAHCLNDKGDPLYSTINSEAVNHGSSWIEQTWAGGAAAQYYASSGSSWGGSKYFLSSFDYPSKKTVYVSIVLRGRDWNKKETDGRYKGRWHDQKEPRFETNYIDGHVDYFNHFWKKTTGYNPGNTSDRGAWNVKNLGLY